MVYQSKFQVQDEFCVISEDDGFEEKVESTWLVDQICKIENDG